VPVLRSTGHHTDQQLAGWCKLCQSYVQQDSTPTSSLQDGASCASPTFNRTPHRPAACRPVQAVPVLRSTGHHTDQQLAGRCKLCQSYVQQDTTPTSSLQAGASCASPTFNRTPRRQDQQLAGRCKLCQSYVHHHHHHKRTDYGDVIVRRIVQQDATPTSSLQAGASCASPTFNRTPRRQDQQLAGWCKLCQSYIQQDTTPTGPAACRLVQAVPVLRSTGHHADKQLAGCRCKLCQSYVQQDTTSTSSLQAAGASCASPTFNRTPRRPAACRPVQAVPFQLPAAPTCIAVFPFSWKPHISKWNYTLGGYSTCRWHTLLPVLPFIVTHTDRLTDSAAYYVSELHLLWLIYVWNWNVLPHLVHEL